jgi:hypothetical protein
MFVSNCCVIFSQVVITHDKDGNIVKQFKKLPGRPARNLTLEQARDMALKKMKVERHLTKFFRPSYVWNAAGRPRSKIRFQIKCSVSLKCLEQQLFNRNYVFVKKRLLSS